MDSNNYSNTNEKGLKGSIQSSQLSKDYSKKVSMASLQNKIKELYYSIHVLKKCFLNHSSDFTSHLLPIATSPLLLLIYQSFARTFHFLAFFSQITKDTKK